MHRILRNFMQNTNAKAVYTRICHRRHRHGNSSRSSSNTSNNSISNNCNCNKNNGKRSWSIKWCTYPSQKHNENVKHTFDQHCRAQREMNTQSLNPSLPHSLHPAQKAECCLSVPLLLSNCDSISHSSYAFCLTVCPANAFWVFRYECMIYAVDWLSRSRGERKGKWEKTESKDRPKWWQPHKRNVADRQQQPRQQSSFLATWRLSDGLIDWCIDRLIYW